jgi:hypothetical protein
VGWTLSPNCNVDWNEFLSGSGQLGFQPFGFKPPALAGGWLTSLVFSGSGLLAALSEYAPERSTGSV